jgi:phenylalanyl-tRNA synthetase beta chain
MKISTALVRFINQHYGSAGDPAPNGTEDLLRKIGAQLAAVDDTEDFGSRFNDVIIVKVVSCEDHPNADRLHVCLVDDDGAVQNVERDENGLVQVVCGAPNVRAGMLAAWLPPGSTVPSSVSSEPFVLESRAIRGVISNGMMASPKELSLSDSHEGILEIDEELGPITPGTMFADAFHLRGDVVIDMENKMFTHRPDCFGWLGLAREIEGIQHRPYTSPKWYRMDPEFPDVEAEELPLHVENHLPELVPRFTAVALSGVKVGPSPVWLQVDLARAGLRSINNIVDYTNHYMLLTGQPLHAYDYDKVRARSGGDTATLVVRRPQGGEKITLLNGKEVVPRAEAIMIATDQELIGIGGVMGGGDTEVDENTTNIILEAATFDMYSIRRTSMAHGIFTDAVTRFNKGQSPLQNLAALAKITNQIRGQASGKVASPLIDINHVPEAAQKRGNIHPPVSVTAQFINDRLGWSLSPEAMAELLANVEFGVEIHGDELLVAAPFWRTDIEIPEDVVEEIGRLNGYDNLLLELPVRDLTPAPKDVLLEIQKRIRDTLAASGANELLTYSFVHGNLLDKVGQDRAQAFKLSNALSPDLQYFRLSLTPSLLEKVHPNIRAGHDPFVLYEIGKAHNKNDEDAEGLPKEVNALALVVAAGEQTAGQFAGAPYYHAKKYLLTILNRFGVVRNVGFEPLEGADLYDNPWIEQMTAPYLPNRSAVLRDAQGLIWGVVGEYRPAVRKALKLPAMTAGFEIDPLLLLHPATHRYVPLPKFQNIQQDICLKVSADMPFAQVFDFVWDFVSSQGISQTYVTIEPVDIYQREDDHAHKQITLRLSLASFERTLTDEEVNKLLGRIAESAKDSLNAERI